MKKLYAIALVLTAISFSNLFGQVTLEKEYDYSIAAPNCSTVVKMFYANDKSYYIANRGNGVDIYNQDHTIYKSVELSNSSEKIEEIYLPSDRLFNSNSEIEFVILSEIEGDYNSYWKILNENGVILQTLWVSDCYFGRIGSENYIRYYKTLDNQAKIALNGSETCNKTLIFDVPGILTNLQETILKNGKTNLYPNPTIDYVNLNIESCSSEQDYKIYNTSGQIILKGKVKPNTSVLNLDVNSIDSGSYILVYNRKSYKFIKK